MKRTISVILAAAILLSILSISVFAESTVHVSFSAPNAGDTMTPINTSITTSPSVSANVKGVFTGEDIDMIKGITSSADLTPIIDNASAPSETYENQSYLVVILLFSADVALSTETEVTFESGVTGNTLVNGDLSSVNSVYVYMEFTPKAVSNTDPDLGSTNDTTNYIPEDNAHDVKVTYDSSVTEKKVYSVTVTWESLEFVYTPKTLGTWNPSTHNYDNATEERWSFDNNKITVINHSNAEIDAVFSYAPNSGFDAITGTFVNAEKVPYTDSKVTINSAVGTTVSNPPSQSVYLLLEGSLDANTAVGAKSGTVTVTIP